MKKIIAVILTLAVLFTLAACSESEPQKTVTRKELAEDAIALLDEMLGSETYRSLYRLTGEALEFVDSLAAAKHDKPAAVYAVRFDIEAALRAEGIALDGGDLPEILRDRLLSSVAASLSTLIASRSTQTLAVAAAYSATVNGFCSDAEGDVFFLYVYDFGAPIAVTFVTNEVGVTQAKAAPLFFENELPQSADALRDALQSVGAPVITVEKIG